MPSVITIITGGTINARKRPVTKPIIHIPHIFLLNFLKNKTHPPIQTAFTFYLFYYMREWVILLLKINQVQLHLCRERGICLYEQEAHRECRAQLFHRFPEQE